MREYTLRDLLYAIAGELYVLSPKNEVRNIDKIMRVARENIISKATNPIGDLYLISFENREELYRFIEKNMECQEFIDLNLSYNEIKKGVSVYDENRPKFTFTTIYDVHTSDSWKDDFMDLTAFVQNVTHKLWDKKQDP